MSELTRRQLLARTTAFALAPVLAACASSDRKDASSADAEDGAFPVTIRHRHGETTITSAPKRVVTIGQTDHDALIAVGVIPIGVTSWYGTAEGQIFPWAQEAFGDSQLPTVLQEFDVEAIAALRPDLIIGQYTWLDADTFDTLSEIAPVVAQPEEYPDLGAPWNVMAMNLGAAVGRPARMRAVVDGVQAKIEATADAYPEFAGREAAVVMPYDGMYVLGPSDPKMQLLSDLGFEYPDEVFPYGEGEEAGVQFSGERIGDLDELDLVVWLSLAAEPAAENLFEATSMAKEGRFVNVAEEDGSTIGVAISYYTPLSIPYILDHFVPQLAVALDGDPLTVPSFPD